jgi:hypothetical protein
MKLFGYKEAGLPTEEIESSELAEITLVATPAELRMIAEFLESTARNMERMGDRYDHEHLSDKNPGFNDSPHFVVFNSQHHSR